MSVLATLGFALAVLGSVIALIGTLGILRLPDLFTRLHAAGVVDTLGALLVLGGLSLAAGVSTEAARMLLILAFLWLTSPTASHALAKSALADGNEPLVLPPDGAVPPLPSPPPQQPPPSTEAAAGQRTQELP